MSSEETVWVVPSKERAALADRYGPIYIGAALELAFTRLGIFATCGDRVTADAIRLGHVPLVGIVDYKTLREEPIDADRFSVLAKRRRVRVRNPPGMLTEGLRRAVKETIASGGGLIEVDGEEDLGSLALVESMPSGATVIYGIPGEGASFVKVDADAKANVRRLIGRMELKRVDLGAHDR